MNKKARIMLIVVAVVCFGVALYYPISEAVQKKQNEDSMDMLAALRDAGLQQAATITEAPATEAPVEPETPVADDGETDVPVLATAGTETVATDAPQQPASQPETNAATQAPAQSTAQSANQPQAGAATQAPQEPETQPTAVKGENTVVTEAPGAVATASAAQGEPVAAVPQTTDAPDAQSVASLETAAPGQEETAATPTPAITPEPTPTPQPTPTPNRMINTGTKTWDELEKVTLDKSRILPQYQQLYAMNDDMVGWMTIGRTKIDFPVMQHEDEEYYLTHDFMHKENANGLLILGTNCDPYTPSYNLVVSGHNRNNGTMFSDLKIYYGDKRHWNEYKYIQFDSLMEQRTYIVFAAFYSGVYEDGEEGFRYNADIKYSIDATQWLQQVELYKLYDTGVDVKFGDQFLTLTTCNSSRRKNGRFVVVARRLREGETME